MPKYSNDKRKEILDNLRSMVNSLDSEKTMLDKEVQSGDQSDVKISNDNLDITELLQNRKTEEFNTTKEFNEHNNRVRKLIIDELESKKFFRKFSYWLIVGLTIILLGFVIIFIFYKSDEASLAFLITVTVSVFANLLALIGIIFKYVFSSTKEITDYATILSDYESKNK